MSSNLLSVIRNIPDFPKPGILFRDITPLLSEPEIFRSAIEDISRRARELRPQAIVGIESRGFIFGSVVAYELGLPFVPVRKSGKLPAQKLTVEYSLEYGTGVLDIHVDALQRGERVLIIDDLLATGGTAAATAKLVEMLGAEVVGLIFLIELETLGGREVLKNHRVESLISYGA